nr:PREDICTED: aspartyl/asparaginyl beta-hydroxylase isoform X2 [Lepisosteus oculatus]
MGESNDMAEDTDAKHIGNKNGKKGDGLTGSSFFTWFMVIALLGVWTSVAVVWFDLVDYEEVLARAKDFRYNISEVLQGKLGVYDADGDGDFDVEDAKVLLGLKEKPVALESTSTEAAEEVAQPLEEAVFELEPPVEDVVQANVVQESSQPPPDKLAEEQDGEEEELADSVVEEEVEEAAVEEVQAEDATELEDEPRYSEPAAEQDAEAEEVHPAEEEEEAAVEEVTPEGEEQFEEGGQLEGEEEELERMYEEETVPPFEEEEAVMPLEAEEEPKVPLEAEEEPLEGEEEPEAPLEGEDEPFEAEEEPVAPLEAEEEESLEAEGAAPELPEEAEATAAGEAVEVGEEHAEESRPAAEAVQEAVQAEEDHGEGVEEMEEVQTEEEYSEYEYSKSQDDQQFEDQETPSEDVQDSALVPENEEDDVYGSQSMDVESEIQAAVPLPEPVFNEEYPADEVVDSADRHPYEDTTEDAIDTQGEYVVESEPEYTEEEVHHPDESVHSEPQLSEEAETQEWSTEELSESAPETHSEDDAEAHHPDEPAHDEPSPEEEVIKAEQHFQGEPSEAVTEAVEKQDEEKPKEKAKKKKPKLLNKFDKTIKAEIDAAEKLRKKGKIEDALQAFESLISKYPQSPRARYGKAQSEDDLAEKMRSNEVLLKAVNTFREAAELPNAPADLVKLALRRRAERQQFLGRMRGALVTLEKLVQLFPEDISLKNDLGVGYLLLGDNKSAKQIYKEVLSIVPNDGFAKVHYGFILKAENMIAESIPYLREGLESGDAGTDDGRFYFHLGDALQRVGDKDAYKWYEIGHKRGHFASVWQRSLYNVNGLKAQAWWTAKETGYTDLVKTLERNWKMIRDEALSVMDAERGLFAPEDENLREKGEWGQFTLWQQGRKNEDSCRRVPKTCTLLDRFPEATACKRGQIKYSVMQPGTHVWPHTGPTNCRLRMHLGLVIPKQGCKIRCANDTRFWEEGKVLIFDDSFEHEVWQDADSYRLIFIVDVWHPELTVHQRRTLSPI